MAESEIDQRIDRLLRRDCALRNYGRVQHGMNGKNADLDRIGQCTVTQLEVVEPEDSKDLKILIHLRLYATVCGPCWESMGCDAIDNIRENASPELKNYFLCKGVDLSRSVESLVEDDYAIGVLVEYFQDQAFSVVVGYSNPVPEDPLAFMWNDDAWEGGTNITLEVPLTCEEWEHIDQLPEDQTKDDEVLSSVETRIFQEILDANKGGTPERDRLKHFEECVGRWNDEINKLECYTQ